MIFYFTIQGRNLTCKILGNETKMINYHKNWGWSAHVTRFKRLLIIWYIKLNPLQLAFNDITLKI